MKISTFTLTDWQNNPIEYIFIDNENGTGISMLKSDYEAQQTNGGTE